MSATKISLKGRPIGYYARSFHWCDALAQSATSCWLLRWGSHQIAESSPSSECAPSRTGQGSVGTLQPKDWSHLWERWGQWAWHNLKSDPWQAICLPSSPDFESFHLAQRRSCELWCPSQDEPCRSASTASLACTSAARCSWIGRSPCEPAPY